MKAIEPLILNATEIERSAPSRGEIIAAIEDVYRMMGSGELRCRRKLACIPSILAVFCMPCQLGYREVVAWHEMDLVFSRHFTRDRPDSTGIIVLNDPDDGLPVAIMEGMWITYARTAACAAVTANIWRNRILAGLAWSGAGVSAIGRC